MAGAVEITRTHSKVLRMDELLEQIRRAADQAGEGLFLELLRWHRAVVGLADFDPRTHGAYRGAIAELGDARAAELLRDLRRAARDGCHSGTVFFSFGVRGVVVPPLR